MVGAEKGEKWSGSLVMGEAIEKGGGVGIKKINIREKIKKNRKEKK